MNELDERVAKLEASSEESAGRLLALERDVGVFKVSCASKADLAEAKSEILVKVAQVETAVRTDLTATESKLRNEISGVESKLRAEISGTENKLRTEIGAVEGRLKAEIVDVKTEIIKTKDRLLFWIVTVIIFGQILPSLLRQFAG